MSPVSGAYDYRHLAVPLLFAIATAAAALELASRVAAHPARAGRKWLWGGAVAMGSGLWAMHLTGMLAYRLPIEVYYHVPTLGISWLGGAFAGLSIVYIASREPMTPAGLAGGSLAVGAGIALMQYAAIGSMRMAATREYRSGPLLASIVLDVLISFVGLLLVSHSRDENHDWTAKLAIMLVIGLAIPLVHSMSMSAVGFIATGTAPDLRQCIEFTPLATAGMVIAAFLVLGSGVLAARADRLRSVKKLSLYDEHSMLRALIDNMPAFMYVKDTQSRFIVANAYAAHAFGVDSPEKLLGKTDFDFCPREMASAFFEDEQNVMRSGQHLNDREERAVHADGCELDILTTKVPVRDHRGRIIGIAGIGRDISARKRMENDLRKAEQKYRGIFDNAIMGIFQSAPDGRLLGVNRSMAKNFGYDSPEEMMASVADVTRAYVNATYRDLIRRLLEEEGLVQNFESEFHRKDGSKAWMAVSAWTVVEDGVVIRYEGICEDIGIRKEMELAVREAEQKYRGIFDNAMVGILQATPAGRVLGANPAMASISGYDSPEEMVATISDMSRQFYADPKRRQEMQLVLAEFGAVQNFEAETIRKDGSRIWLSMSVIAVRENDEIVRYEGMCQDVSARKKMESALREAEQTYRGIFDNAIFGIFQSTPEGKVLSVNSSMVNCYGYDSAEEAIAGISDVSRQVYVDPNRRKEFKRRMEEDGAVQNFEYEAYRKDGSKIWLSMSARAIRENGVVVRYEGMSEDISERYRLREQLLQAQKLESVGQLAAGIAHEINTPTQYIGDNVRFLKDAFQDLKSLLASYERRFSAAGKQGLSGETTEEAATAVEGTDTGYLLEEIPKAIDQSLEGVGRVAALVSAMKEFSHPDTKEKSPLDLNRAIAATITVARNEWKYVADVETDFDPSLPPVTCHPGEVNQVILNLVVNAAHAIGDMARNGGSQRGTISVRTLRRAEWAEIRIEDTGTGIPEKVRTRIFDPFFTTKEIGKGTGQGLAIARSVIVGKHGGSLHFETEEGKGTTFIIRLPYDGKTLEAKAAAA
ncbi:MAG: PAS domain S-box protein [Terracidiphilus sp.]